MRTIPASDAAQLCGGTLRGPADTTVGPDVVTDHRQTTRGALFVALRGEHADGHDFVASAVAAGAGAVLVSRVLPGIAASQIVVHDTQAGLSALAGGLVREAVADHGLITLALTGSSGKTTTKDLLAQVLNAAGATVAPAGSFNNEVGVPLTACAIDATTRFLVAEMGARGPGHIAWLCGIVPPRIGAVLNVGTAHLGEFGSREAIAAAKGELVEALPSDGVAVLNADDPLVAGMAARTGARPTWFSAGAPVVDPARIEAAPMSVQAEDQHADELERYAFRLVGRCEGVAFDEPVRLRLVGAHAVPDALAAAAMALAAGLAPAAVARSLSTAEERSPWRMALHELAGGAVLINDAYNANPDSVRAALDTVGTMIARRRLARPNARATAVLGDMLELGDESAELHRAIGGYAAERGIAVIAVGSFAAETVAGAVAAGGQAGEASLGEIRERLAPAAGDVVLVKASRGLGLPEAELDRRGLGLERLARAIVDEQEGRAR